MEEEIEIKETSKKQDFVSTLSYRIIGTVGCTASILIILLIALWSNLIPKGAEGISLSIGLFISLPLVFSFIFGIITNKPNFSQTLRHYGFGLYILIALVIYFIYMKPDSFTLFGKYLIQFFIGFFIALIAGLFYLIPYRLLRKQKYRIKASISFVVSFLITFIIIVILNRYLFKLII